MRGIQNFSPVQCGELVFFFFRFFVFIRLTYSKMTPISKSFRPLAGGTCERCIRFFLHSFLSFHTIYLFRHFLHLFFFLVFFFLFSREIVFCSFIVSFFQFFVCFNCRYFNNTVCHGSPNASDDLGCDCGSATSCEDCVILT